MFKNYQVKKNYYMQYSEKKLEKLNQAGTQSWSALMAALTETRTAFDRANEAAREAFKRAA